MKHVFFKTLKLQNFFSVGEDPIEIEFKPGMHVITGNNKDKIDRKNGVGKSTIADAFYFAIFGKTIRDINKKDLIVNNITNGKCSVSLKFKITSPEETSEYLIQRSLNPSKLILIKNGEDITRDSIANTTQYILELIEASGEIFKNCVVMTSNNTIPFMGQKVIAKRKFIENIFSLEVFGEMLKIARNDYNEIKRDYEIDLTKLEEKNKSHTNYKDQREDILKSRKDKLVDYNKRYKDNKNTIKNLNSKLNKIKEADTTAIKSKLDEVVDGIERVESKIRDQLEICAEIKTDIKRDGQDYKNIGTTENKCPTCLRQIEDHDRDCISDGKKIIAEKIKTRKEELEVCNKTISKLQSVKDKLNESLIKIQQKLNAANVEASSKDNIEQNIKQHESWIESLEIDIANLKSTETNIDSIINEVEKEIENISQKVEKNRDMMNIIDIGKFVVSEEGVKAYIVKQILQIFNSRLAYYLKKMDANCICVFNEYFEEEIINDNNKICSYYNFSDGERKNIDLACLFTFADARRMQGNVAYNVSFFDELYDSSLDSKGVELVNNILNDRVSSNNECVFVITHRPEAIKSITDNAEIIYLQKENGITTRVKSVDV